jgi:hypothetical protein
MCLERHLSHFFGKKTLEIHGNSRTKCFTSPCVIDSQPSMLYLSPFTIQIANRLLYPTNKSAISMVIYIYYIRQFPTKTLSDLSAFRTRPWRNWPLRTPWSPRRCIPRRAKSSTLSGRPVGTPPAGGNRLVGTCIGQQWCTWYLFVKWKVMITGWWDILGMFPSGKLT